MSGENGTSPLSRDELLALEDRPVEFFTMPDWGGRTVRLRAPSLTDVLAAADGAKKTKLENAREMLMIGLVDENGAAFLTAEDADALLARLSIPSVTRLTKRLTQLCGVEAEPDEKK